nr:K711 [uncultured bacterium]
MDADQGRQRADIFRRRRVRGQCGHASRHARGLGRGRNDRVAERVEAHQLAVERGVLVLGLVVRKVCGEAVDRLPAGGDSAADAIIGVPADRPGQRILDGRVLVLDHAVDLDREVVEGGEVQMDLAVILAIIADAAGHATAKFAGRRLGDDAQRAAFGVAAEQSALRSAQHLDALHIEQRRVQALLAAQIDAVDIDADALITRGLVGVERHDAANADGQRGLARLEGRDAQRGHGAVGQVHQALDMPVGDHRRVDYGNRDRRLLQVRLALGRGDHDGVEPVVQGSLVRHRLRRGGLILSQSGARNRREERAAKQELVAQGGGRSHFGLPLCASDSLLEGAATR